MVRHEVLTHNPWWLWHFSFSTHSVRFLCRSQETLCFSKLWQWSCAPESGDGDTDTERERGREIVRTIPKVSILSTSVRQIKTEISIHFPCQLSVKSFPSALQKTSLERSSRWTLPCRVCKLWSSEWATCGGVELASLCYIYTGPKSVRLCHSVLARVTSLG